MTSSGANHIMPHLTERAIDHLVLPVNSLAQSRERYEALGFSVQSERQHPFGTANACIYFANGTYLEPLAVADREGVEDAIRENNLFAARQGAYRFRHGEGFAMMAMRTSDANADQKLFSSEGYARGAPFSFERIAQSAGGEQKMVGFRLAIAVDERAPDTTLFTCERLSDSPMKADNATEHQNHATGVLRVFMVEPNPTDFQYYLQVLTGQRSIRATSFGIEADVDGGEVSIVTPTAFTAWFGEAANVSHRGLALKAFVIAAPDLELVASLLDRNAVTFLEVGNRLVVPPEPGQGSVLAFERADP